MPKAQAGNPDWVDWVQELVDDAEAIGSKASQTYKKAAHSLRSCPITFQHPEDALCLSGVGPKVVAHLTKKLKEQCESHGVSMPDRVGPASPRKAKKTAAKGSKRSAPRDELDGELDPRDARRQRLSKAVEGLPGAGALTFDAHPDGHIFNDIPDDEVLSIGGKKGKTKGKGKAKESGGAAKEPKSREYIPRQNSGPYAILLALYKNASCDERQTWITKGKIFEDGEEYSNTPFEGGTANRGGQIQAGQGFTYTAWNGMKMLLSKDLAVTDNKRPAKYALTQSGYGLAERLAPSAGLAVHARPPTSSAGSFGQHPSSSGFGAGESTQGTGRAASRTAAGDGAYRPDFGAVFGAPAAAGPSFPRHASIHAAGPRRRQATPDLFGGESTSARAGQGAPPAAGADGEGDAVFEQQMRRALELSRQESIASSSPAAGDLGLGGVASASASHASSGLNGRKAAKGMYAAASAETREAPAVKNVDSAFGYYYLNEDDARCTDRGDAEVSQTEEGELLFRIEYRAAQDLHPMVRGLKRIASLNRSTALPGGLTKSAYIRERVSNEVAPGFPGKGSSASASTTAPVAIAKPPADPFSSLLGGYKAPPTKSAKDAMYAPPTNVRILGGDGTAAATSSGRGVGNVSDVLARFKDGGPALSSSPAAGPAVPSHVPARRPRTDPVEPPVGLKRPRLPSPTRSTEALPSGRRAQPTVEPPQVPLGNSDLLEKSTGDQPLVVNRHPLDPVRDHTSITPYHHKPFTPIVWPKGTFQIYLIVDSREGTREAGKRIELCEKMEREGVRVAGKMMPLGDMLWVARRIDPVTGRPTGADDVVLDAIVERKRLDDLCNSIIDGRYVGQKFRLKDSGITHRIYLIEKYDVAAQYERYGKQIWTSKSQLQVNDGFYVHESANIADTISYLRKRTQVMTELYESQDLHIIPDACIDRATYIPMQQHLRATQPAQSFLTSYTSFCDLNRSDASLTLKTQWASMIQRVSGLGAEKAVQFIARWETPRAFWDEAKRHEAEVEAERRRLDREEAIAADEAAAAAAKSPGNGKGKGRAKKVERRQAEDFVFSELDGGGTRGIKGKLGAKIWELFRTAEPRYARGA